MMYDEILQKTLLTIIYKIQYYTIYNNNLAVLYLLIKKTTFILFDLNNRIL